MGLFSIIMLVVTPSQVRLPMYDSGAPSPRIIPVVVLVLTLICSIVLLIQSLVFKKEKIYEFDWKNEKPCILLIIGMCIYTALMILIGFVAASIITFVVVLLYTGEKKPSVYIVAIVAAVVIYFLFKYVFNISLPEFPLLGGLI